MTAVLGQWRATYTPGDWLVLSGPTSLVCSSRRRRNGRT